MYNIILLKETTIPCANIIMTKMNRIISLHDIENKIRNDAWDRVVGSEESTSEEMMLDIFGVNSLLV